MEGALRVGENWHSGARLLVFCMPDTNPFCQADVPIKRLSLAPVQRCQEFEPADSKGMLLCLNVLPPQLNRNRSVCVPQRTAVQFV